MYYFTFSFGFASNFYGRAHEQGAEASRQFKRTRKPSQALGLILCGARGVLTVTGKAIDQRDLNANAADTLLPHGSVLLAFASHAEPLAAAKELYVVDAATPETLAADQPSLIRWALDNQGLAFLEADSNSAFERQMRTPTDDS